MGRARVPQVLPKHPRQVPNPNGHHLHPPAPLGHPAPLGLLAPLFDWTLVHQSDAPAEWTITEDKPLTPSDKPKYSNWHNSKQ